MYERDRKVVVNLKLILCLPDIEKDCIMYPVSCIMYHLSLVLQQFFYQNTWDLSMR